MIIEEIGIGITVMMLVMLIHLMATYILLDFADAYDNRFKQHPRLRLLLALTVANVVLLIAHLIEVGFWATVYAAQGIVEDHNDAFYSAFVNYTALGFGESTQDAGTRLIDPMTAGSGIMMFGWSTALLFLVIQQHLPEVRRPPRRRAPRREEPGREAAREAAHEGSLLAEAHEATGAESSPRVTS
ncbi:two pore domain potassium channel family protein [Ancylobacter sp. IITR112]|uniref:two pore domain potassium channel family protein n=1 Tax=Ancylobacter sp. IITR112 TaxID=3138073 RepID=UPI00352B5748